jgi:hypothetical protein
MPQFNVPDVSPFVTTVDGKKLYWRSTDIPGWNMLTAQLRDFFGIVPLGAIVVSQSAFVADDANIATRKYFWDLFQVDPNTGLAQGSIYHAYGGITTVCRTDGGIFQAANFQSTAYNRGIYTVCYFIP